MLLFKVTKKFPNLKDDARDIVMRKLLYLNFTLNKCAPRVRVVLWPKEEIRIILCFFFLSQPTTTAIEKHKWFLLQSFGIDDGYDCNVQSKGKK